LPNIRIAGGAVDVARVVFEGVGVACRAGGGELDVGLVVRMFVEIDSYTFQA
jgi:hypothetical protein